MSQYWGYVCESHDPPIESDRWLNHGDDALADLFHKVRNGEWPQSAGMVPEYRLAYGDSLAPMVVGFGVAEGAPAYAIPVRPVPGGGAPPWHGPVDWLAEHPHCKVVLKNEYGDRRGLGEIVAGSVSPPAVEP